VFHIILYQPEIPPNTGNVIRLCANTGCSLHLVGRLGFELENAALRRAGLDYHDLTDVHTHADLGACLQAIAQPRLFAIETGAGTRYSDARFLAGDALLFGAETRGLPPEVLATVEAAHRLAIPMRDGNRSLNLSNAVAVVVYEAWRQLRFEQAR
jgi:tRNA (cytidine/uridine-2'-O-)-methyltransferase